MLIHRGERYQVGRGLGSLFSGLFRTLRPLFSKGLATGQRLLSSNLAKKVGSTALDIGKRAATNIAVDILEGKNVKESLNKELETAKSDIANKIRGGRKRKKKTDCTSVAKYKKRRYNLLD